MSECVVRMEMPIGCIYCPFFNKEGCKASNRMFPDWMNVATRPKDCPILCQLPKGHGRLVDADAAIEDIRGEILEHQMNGMKDTPFYIEDLRTMWQRLEDEDLVPTIVPAERGET